MSRGRKSGTGDPMDDFLSSLGLVRKPTAKDGSCLFRAVSEQVFYCQALHNEVREACINYMERNREKFEPEWAGQIEISAMSLMYRRDFLIYQQIGKSPSLITDNGFEKKILLCFSGGNHYDSIYSKSFQECAGICQSIVYGLLYNDVFTMKKEVQEAIDLLRSKSKRKQSDCSIDGVENIGRHDGGTSELETSTESEKSKDGDKVCETDERRLSTEVQQRKPAFPYKVAKALDPEIYRNVHFDDGTSRYFNAHIQEVHSQDGPVTVFIEDLGERHTLPMKNLKPLMCAPNRQWMGTGNKGYKNLSGYYHKPINGYVPDYNDPKNKRKIKRGGKAQYSSNMYQGPPGQIMPQYQQPFEQQPMMCLQQPERQKQPQKFNSPPKQPPRFMNRVNQENSMEPCQSFVRTNKPFQQECHQMSQRPQWSYTDRPPPPNASGRGRGGGRYAGRGSPKNFFGHTPEEREEKKALEESMALYEIQERDSHAFPALPTAQNTAGVHVGPASFWGKLGKERSATPPINIPTSMGQDEPVFVNGVCIDDGQMKQMMTPPSQFMIPQPVCASPQPIQLQQYSSSPAGNNSMGNVSPAPVIMAANNYVQQQSIPSGVPMYPVILPIVENLTGPVNYGISPSRDAYGSDLPMSDTNTLRFFFNMGVEYYHRYMQIIQMQQAQQNVMAFNMGVVPHASQPAVLGAPQQSTNMDVPCNLGNVEDRHYGSDVASSLDDTEDQEQLNDGQSIQINSFPTADGFDPNFSPCPRERANSFQFDLSTGQNSPVHDQTYASPSCGYSQNDRYKQRRYSGGGGGGSFKNSPPRFRHLRSSPSTQTRHQLDNASFATSQQYSANMHDFTNQSQHVPHRPARNSSPLARRSAPINIASSSPRNISANPLTSSPSHTGPSMQYYADGNTNQSSAPTGSYYNAGNQGAANSTEHFTSSQSVYDNHQVSMASNYQFAPHQWQATAQQANNNAYIYSANNPQKAVHNVYGTTPPFPNTYTTQAQYIAPQMVSQTAHVHYSS
uniref:Bifunctional UDP-N-acetylglucosamine transferase and deubiquitinase ALG13-like n=1 Tax=Saccoglossus kowalevskii TaxID=10224 RepID=A0ABM0MUP7_SACKO|nr:PREDICTED: putative bifunctional UDP-N-acetylglucosamine transferase and deubiquitinase ALG13-like [Saccoglossus kowalevskii]